MENDALIRDDYFCFSTEKCMCLRVINDMMHDEYSMYAEVTVILVCYFFEINMKHLHPVSLIE